MKTLFLFVAILVSSISQAQNLSGLWGITSVQVGKETMTPVAKWFRLNQDKTQASGNGWTQNMVGAWSYDNKTMELAFTNTYGIKDEFGPFSVTYSNDEMEWTREEEGMKVTVQAVRIEEIPAAPADLFAGLWIPDGKSGENLFIRSDRLYVKTIKQDKNTGYWHINGHRPEVTFLPHEENQTPETWNIEVDATTLIMTGISDDHKDQVITYKRTSSF